MKQKGQAAVTDSLYFLLIITFLSVFLFGFANSYGSAIKEQFNDEYNTTFATNALKTILYSSTPRDPDESVFESSAEIDYLLAVVKEDYSDDLQMDEREMKVLAKTISSVLSPVEDTLDYVFYLHLPSEEQKMVFLFVHTTNFRAVDADLPGGDFYVYSSDDNEPHKSYFCGVEKSGDALVSAEGSDYISLMAKLARLRANIGPTSEASASIKLVRETSQKTFESFQAEANLMLWEAVWLGRTSERTQGLFYDINPDELPWDYLDIDPAWQCIAAEIN